jgi:hypothetical protein
MFKRRHRVPGSRKRRMRNFDDTFEDLSPERDIDEDAGCADKELTPASK